METTNWQCHQEQAPPTNLPGEFDSCIDVYEIVVSEFPAYVYLATALLTDRIYLLTTAGTTP